MEGKVEELLNRGIRPCDLPFLTVAGLKQVCERFLIDYSGEDTKSKEEFQLFVHTSLTLKGAYLDDDDSKSKLLAQQIKLQELEATNLASKKEVLTLELEIKKAPVPQEPHPMQPKGITTNVIPPFDEDDPQNFFEQFEKIAFLWDKSLWPILVQTGFKGKAKAAFAALTKEQSKDYDVVRERVLTAYKLNPEAYRQQFRSGRMDPSQTFKEFVAEKQRALNKWLEASQLTTFEKLQEAILVEEFLNKISLDMRQYLTEREIEGIENLVKAADAFALTQKLGKSSGKGSDNKKHKKTPNGKETEVQKSVRKHCSKCGHWGPEHDKCPDTMKKVECRKCHQTGHFANVCSNSPGKDQKGKGKVAFVQTNLHEEKIFEPHLYQCEVSPSRRKKGRSITLLRDTGAAQSLIVKSALTKRHDWYRTGESVIIRAIGGQRYSVPLVKAHLKSEIYSGPCHLGIVDSMPIESAQLLLGNDVFDKQPSITPVLFNQVVVRKGSPVSQLFPSCAINRALGRKEDQLESLPSCAITRAQAKEESRRVVAAEPQSEGASVSPMIQVDKVTLPEDQRNDPSLNQCFAMLEGKERCPSNVDFFLQGGVLVRRWTSLTSQDVAQKGDTINQVVLPVRYRSLVLETAHSIPMSGHLGIKTTYEKVLRHFFWPGMRNDVNQFVRSCLECQKVGKPNQKIPPAKLYPIPAVGDPFSEIQVDFVGPLPKTTSGKQYLLTIMCKVTRYPEAIPLSSTRTVNVIKALRTFFGSVGLPTIIQSDNDSSFTSESFKQFLSEHAIEQVLATPYRPQSQGALERYHQTLKSMLKKFCLANAHSWDTYVPYLLFCTRDTVQESLGFSPFQLVFGHRVRGPLSVLKSQCLSTQTTPNLLERVTDLHEKLRECRELARENLERSQVKMKSWYDRKSKDRSFSQGDKCLVFLPIAKGALSAKYFGPYVVLEKLSSLTYKIATPDRGRKSRVCHINQMKEFIGPNSEAPERVVSSMQIEEGDDGFTEFSSPRLANSAIMADLPSYLSELGPEEQTQITALLESFPEVFSDKLGRTNVLVHDVELISEEPVKQRPYRTSPSKAQIMKEEVQYLLDEGLATPSQGEWASPCILVPKPDGTSRFCVDFRQANKLIKADAFPMPRLLDCVDQVGDAKFISKLDLLKGYWQVPLSEKAQRVYSFITMDGLFSFNVLPFGCKNAPACFQRLMNRVVQGIPKVSCYLDDIIVYSDTLREHLEQLTALLTALRSANLVVNLAKSEFVKGTVEYLGHVVGQGQIKPKHANVQALLDMPAPSDLRSLRRFLGASGFYRRFCKNFSSVCLPLTNLLQKGRKFVWSAECQRAYEDVRAMLSFSPVLKSPCFRDPFIIYTDASGSGIGSVLMQKDNNGIERPIAYYSKKLNKHQLHYAPIEKECLAIVMSVAHFSVYLNNGHVTTVFTDHNPLAFLNKMKERNQKLLRWSLFLQEFNLDIKHIKGSDNVIADMLSRA